MSEEVAAGRELNARIAGQIMKWYEINDKWISGDDYTSYGAGGARGIEPIWDLSCNIAHAWLVLEKLQTRGYTATIFVTGMGVFVRIELGGSVAAYIQESGLTAPHAICLAALKAMEHSV